MAAKEAGICSNSSLEPPVKKLNGAYSSLTLAKVPKSE